MAALLVIASLAPFSCAPLAWIALVPAWWVLARSESVRRRPFRYGYLLGLLYFGATFWWICDVTFLGIVFLIPYLALYPAFWFLFVARFLQPWKERGNAGLVVQALGAAALWVTLEWWRSWFLSGFDWNELGDSQATSIAFRQLAAFGGVHLISFVLVAVNVLWAEGFLRWRAICANAVRCGFRFGVHGGGCSITVVGGFRAGLRITCCGISGEAQKARS